MNIRQTLAAAAALAAAGGLVAATPGQAATTGSTGVTFEIPVTELSITVPANAPAALTFTRNPLGGATVSGSLGSATVTDGRTAATRLFTVTATSTGFNRTGGSIGADKASIGVPASGLTGAPSWTNAAAAALPGTPGTNLSGSGQAFLVGAVALGVGSVTYSPDLTITLAEGDIVPGSYTGSVVQTVS